MHDGVKVPMTKEWSERGDNTMIYTNIYRMVYL